jgi:hypothetical protein
MCLTFDSPRSCSHNMITHNRPIMSARRIGHDIRLLKTRFDFKCMLSRTIFTSAFTSTFIMVARFRLRSEQTVSLVSFPCASNRNRTLRDQPRPVSRERRFGCDVLTPRKHTSCIQYCKHNLQPVVSIHDDHSLQSTRSRISEVSSYMAQQHDRREQTSQEACD